VVFWDPLLCKAVIPATGVTRPPFPISTPFSSYYASAAQAHVFTDSAGVEHVLLVSISGTAQLAVAGASVLKPAYLLAELKLAHDCKARLEAIAAFNALPRSNGRMTSLTDLAVSRRLLFVLRTLDASLRGASHRRIAEALYGAARARKDWRDPGGHMRDAVRRAVRRGRHLMELGYLTLLA
jgi:hypothetical protein